MPLTASQTKASKAPDSELLDPTTIVPSADTAAAELWNCPPGRSPRGVKVIEWAATSTVSARRQAIHGDLVGIRIHSPVFESLAASPWSIAQRSLIVHLDLQHAYAIRIGDAAGAREVDI